MDKQRMTIEYDPGADALYISFDSDSERSVKSTQGDWPFHVDIAEDSTVIGIEIMDASLVMSKEYLEKYDIRKIYP